MTINSSEELLDKLKLLALKTSMTVDGASHSFAPITDAQHNRLIEQVNELLDKTDKIVINLLKLAKAYQDTFPKEDE